MLLVQRILVIMAGMLTVIFLCGIPGFLDHHLDEETLFLLVLISIVLVLFALLPVVVMYLFSRLLMRCFQYDRDSAFSDAGKK
ncbi:hypothetical protein [uncultured Gimesia sp.]|uniref:hypothetical protein n=1 Tax=uncultured Gimesia sp. TaxID=1678688 RepID=UPI0030DC1002|tara:strand:+ start:146103 stop:146351 length:249 start_codon:yes stop_codon:yes gene_type:complete